MGKKKSSTTQNKKDMKRITLFALAVFLGISQALTAATTTHAQKLDTILIELGQNSRIILVVQDQQDLEMIQNYDINQMLKDLQITIDSSDQEVSFVQITDESGTRYLKDTSIVWSTDQDPRYQAEIKIGNSKLEVKTDDWDDLEDEFEDKDMEVKKYSYVEDYKYRTKHSVNVELGMNNWLENGEFPNNNNRQYSVRPWGSWYLALASVHKSRVGGPLFVEWGFSASMYNWKFEDDGTLLTKAAEGVEFAPSPVTVEPVKSKLSAYYVNATFVPMLDFGHGTRRVKAYERGSIRYTSYKKRGIRIGAGGYAGYRLGSHTKVVTENSKDKDRGDFYLTNFRYGLRAQFGYRGFDFFANYDMNEVFAEGRGPSLNALSFGIIF